MILSRVLAASMLALAVPSYSQTLITSRIFGGSGTESPKAIAVDAQGNIYVAGQTTSSDLPTPHGFQTRPAVLPFSVSTDGGVTFSSSTIPGVSDVAAFGTSPDGNILYAGTSVGIRRSADGGLTWTAPSPGLSVLPQVLAVNPRDSNIVFAGASSGLYRSVDSGAQWSLIPSALSGYNATLFHQIVIDPLQPDRIFAVAGNVVATSGIYRSDDGGDTWTPVSLPPNPTGGLSIALRIAVYPINRGTVYVGSWTTPLLKTTDGGNTWTQLSATYGSVYLDPVNPSVLYILTGVGLERSTDGGNSFVKTGFTVQSVTGFAVDPGNSARLYAHTTQALYVSSDSGATWTQNSRIHAVAQLAAVPGRLLIGTQIPPHVYVAKFDSTLSQLLYATYLGGSGYQSVSGLAVDASGNAYVVGLANAPDFPVTSNVLQTAPPSPTGGMFLSKISADGSQLLASTYFGNGSQIPYTIAVDARGAVYVGGYSQSSALVTTANAYERNAPGPCTRPFDARFYFTPKNAGNGFVSKLSPDLSSLIYSTYLAGTCGSDVFSIHADNAGVATVVGGTYSLDFPTTSDSMIPQFPATYSAGYLAQLSADGSALTYSTFLGAGATNEARAFTTDSAGNWYVTGGGSPTLTAGAYQASRTGSCPFTFSFGPPVPHPPVQGEDAFVIAFHARSKAPILAATVGGACFDSAASIALDAVGNIWITGNTGSNDFPSKALIGGLGVSGGFIASLTPDGANLLSAGSTGSDPRLASTGSSIAATVAAEVSRPLANRNGVVSTTSIAAIDSRPPAVIIDEIGAFSNGSRRTAVAPGQLIRIEGRNLGPAEKAAGTVSGGMVGTTAAGVQVLFDGIPAPLLTVQDRAIECVVPFGIQGKYSTVMQVTRDGASSNPIAELSFSSAADVIVIVNADGSRNSPEHPARIGSTISLFVTGLGPQNPPVADGAVTTAISPAPPVELGVFDFGGTLVQPSYVGSSIGLVAGVIQVNVPVPRVDTSRQPVALNNRYLGVPVYVAE